MSGRARAWARQEFGARYFTGENNLHLPTRLALNEVWEWLSSTVSSFKSADDTVKGFLRHITPDTSYVAQWELDAWQIATHTLVERSLQWALDEACKRADAVLEEQRAAREAFLISLSAGVHEVSRG